MFMILVAARDKLQGSHYTPEQYANSLEATLLITGECRDKQVWGGQKRSCPPPSSK